LSQPAFRAARSAGLQLKPGIISRRRISRPEEAEALALGACAERLKPRLAGLVALMKIRASCPRRVRQASTDLFWHHR
jgi:hypothetical protein